MAEQNERLRAAIASAGLHYGDLAARTGTDPKTVERWITRGRLPHRRTRLTVADALGVTPDYLWPETAQEPRTQAASAAELIHFYPSRSTVPPDLWRSLIDNSREAIEVLAYAASFMFENYDLANVAREKADAGVKLRLLFGDQDCEAVRLRAQEEGTDAYLQRACQLTRRYLRDVSGYRGGSVQVRTHTARLYNSIYRFDQDLIVNTHVLGAPAGQNPMLHLRRIPGGRVWSHYMQSFEWVWERATPEPVGRLSTEATAL